MQINEIKVDGLRREFEVTIPHTQFEHYFNERLLRIGQTAKIPGFRPGKVPLSILKQRYGHSIKSEVLDQALQAGVQYLLSEKKLKPAVQPRVDLKDYSEGKDIHVSVSLEVLPEVKPVPLEELAFEKTVCDFPDEKFKAACEDLCKRNRTSGEAQDKAAEKGDAVLIDFDSHLEDGSAIEEGQGKDVLLELGSDTFLPGFEDKLIGAKAGDEVTIPITLPEDYHLSHVAGKKAIFTVKVREVRPIHTPELNDELAVKLGFQDVKALEDFIKKQLEERCKRMSFLIVKRQILDHFAETIQFDVPQSLVDLEFKTIWEQHRTHVAKAIGANPSQKDDHAASAEEEEREKQQYRDIAERRVRLGLVLADIGRQYEVHVTQRELEAAILQVALRYPGKERQVFDFFRNNKSALANLRAPIFEDKVIELIIDKAKITEKKVSFNELEQLVTDLLEGEEEHTHSENHQDSELLAQS
jgi:trigger factor